MIDRRYKGGVISNSAEAQVIPDTCAYGTIQSSRGVLRLSHSLLVGWRALLSAIRRTILLKAHIQHQRNLVSSLQLLPPSVNKAFPKSLSSSEFTILFPSTSAEYIWSPLFRAFTAFAAESRSSPIIMTRKILHACPIYYSQREPPRQQ